MDIEPQPLLSQPSQRSRWWIVSLLLFSMVTPGLTIPVVGRVPNISLYDVLLPLVVVYLASQNLVGSISTPFPDKKMLILATAYLMAHLASMTVNYLDLLRSVLAIKIFLFGFLMYWVVTATVRSPQALAWVTYSFVALGATLAGILIVLFVTDWSALMQASYEVKDQIEFLGWARSNYLAALLVPLVPIAVGAAVVSSGAKRLAMMVAASLMAFGLLITMSKGAVLSLLIGTFCALPILLKGGLRVRHVILLLGCIALFVMILPKDLLTANYGMVMYRIANPDFNRLDLWRVAWEKFTENPILGVGPYCIYIYNRQFAIDDLYSHNFVLNALADLGIVGAIPFLLIIWTAMRRSYTACMRAINSHATLRWLPICLFVSVISTLIHGLVEPTFPGREYSVIFWVCISLVWLYDPRQGAHFAQSGNWFPRYVNTLD